jgi:hypothetical protein
MYFFPKIVTKLIGWIHYPKSEIRDPEKLLRIPETINEPDPEFGSAKLAKRYHLHEPGNFMKRKAN